VKSFEYAAPKNLEDAANLLAETWGQTEILAGGTDLVTSLKQGITAPNRVVSLKNIAALKGIKTSGKELRIGAMATLEELASNATAQKEFPALVTAAQSIASAQMMSVGTVGGDLCQRPRCWYFRNGHGLLARSGETSLARTGENRYHAIFGNDGPALFVSASSLGPALIALGATIVVSGPKGKKREIPAAQFFQTPKSESERETTLKPNEILAEIRVPMRGLKNATYEIRHRHGLDWPYVTATVAFALKAGVASETRVVLGHVAPVPWAAAAAGKALDGQTVDEGQVTQAGAAAATGAKPLSGNAYKVQLVKTAVKRAALMAAGA
jgi:xanthine dehydrogenase YagS FAD-binding subunit